MARIKRGFRYSDYEGGQIAPVRTARVRPLAKDENLTGFVQGLPASDLEERLARSFYRFKIPFLFQVPIETSFSLPWQQKEVDFVVRGNQPVEPDGQISHYMKKGQRADDMVRDLYLNDAFRKMGWYPIIHIKYTKLDTQDMTDRTVRELRL